MSDQTEHPPMRPGEQKPALDRLRQAERDYVALERRFEEIEADRDHARRIAVALENENARLTAELDRIHANDSADAAAGSYASRAERAEADLAAARATHDLLAEIARDAEAERDQARETLAAVAAAQPGTGNEEQLVRAAVLSHHGTHRYLSTYCVHHNCQDCRRICKDCGQPCRCGCHAEPQDEEGQP